MTLTKGDTDAIRWKLVKEVGGTVQGVDHPTILLSSIGGRSLFGNEPSLGQQFAEGSNDKLFRAFVDIRHIVMGMLPLYALVLKALTFLCNICASPTGYVADLYGQ